MRYSNGEQGHAERPQTGWRTGVEQRRAPSPLPCKSDDGAVEVATRPRRSADRRSRPQRWHDAVKELLDLQAAYADWFAILPDGLRGSQTAEALEAIVDLDLTDLAECEPPRGYGRD